VPWLGHLRRAGRKMAPQVVSMAYERKKIWEVEKTCGGEVGPTHYVLCGSHPAEHVSNAGTGGRRVPILRMNESIFHI
jgi:hypothetical protein